MNSNQRTLFGNLLKKLNFKDPSKLGIKNGALTKLLIHARSNRWVIYLTLDSIMAYKTFLIFSRRLHKAFKSVSTIDVVIQARHPKVTSSLIVDYWPWVLKHCELSTTMIQLLTQHGHLKIINDHVALDTKDEALRGLLINGALVPIETAYYRIGFPRFKIKVLGGVRKLPAKLINFPIKKGRQDIELARKAGEALDHDQSK